MVKPTTRETFQKAIHVDATLPKLKESTPIKVRQLSFRQPGSPAGSFPHTPWWHCKLPRLVALPYCVLVLRPYIQSHSPLGAAAHALEYGARLCAYLLWSNLQVVYTIDIKESTSGAMPCLAFPSCVLGELNWLVSIPIRISWVRFCNQVVCDCRLVSLFGATAGGLTLATFCFCAATTHILSAMGHVYPDSHLLVCLQTLATDVVLRDAHKAVQACVSARPCTLDLFIQLPESSLVSCLYDLRLLQEKMDHIGIVALILGTPITALLVCVRRCNVAMHPMPSA